MQDASQTYKQVMKETWRDLRSYLRITIGVVNQEAQESAAVPNPERYTYYSNLLMPLDNYEVTELYAACDQDYTPVDGSVYFLPRSKADVVLNQGIVTDALLGSIEIRFPYAMDIKGLTVEFGKAYPVDFRIESDRNTVAVTGNAAGHFVTEEIFSEATFLRFVPSRMVNGQGRLRIHQLTMGMGIYFDGKKILSATKKEHLSPVMEELPTIDFTAAIENKDRAFDVENSASVLNFLEVGQSVEVVYGQELPDGSTEWLPGAVLSLREWSADDEEMSFSASDRFEDLDGTYYRGEYRAEGISLYDLAVDVFEDAGIDPRDYWLDTYLKMVLVQNPMPPVTHKEALQIIANAGRCILYQDRSGDFYLKSSFLPDMAAHADDATYFSHPDRVLDGKPKETYALTGLDCAETAPGLFFLPHAGAAEFLTTGYISEATAEQDGSFAANPTITIEAEAAFKCFGLTLAFKRPSPKELVIRTYQDGILREEIPIDDVREETVLSHEFQEFNRLVVEITKHCPVMTWFIDGDGNYLTDGEGVYLADDSGRMALHPVGWRVTLDNVSFGDRTDYHLEYGTELTKTPKGTQLAKVKELQVLRTLYHHHPEVKELAKETISGSGQYTFYFNTPSYGLSCTLTNAQDGQTVVMVGQSSYYATVAVTGVAGEAEVVIRGHEYLTIQASVRRPLHPAGTLATWENPLISTEGQAAELAMWIGDYLAADRDYDLQYRGEPRLDANDLAYLENKYIPDMLVRIYDHSLTYNGALSGTLKAKRMVEGG